MTDVGELRRLIDHNPWVTLVSDTPDGLVASHYAVMLDPARDDLTIVGHVGKPDDLIHGLGERELLVVVQGAHGYISPSWYGNVSSGPVASVPTWNFISAHLSGVPELLDTDENLRVLDALVDRFEPVLDASDVTALRASVAAGDYVAAYARLDRLTDGGTISVDTALLVELVLLGQAIRAG